MGKINNLHDFLKDLADTIREKTGVSESLNPQQFSTKIKNLEGSGVPTLRYLYYDISKLDETNDIQAMLYDFLISLHVGGIYVLDTTDILGYNVISQEIVKTSGSDMQSRLIKIAAPSYVSVFAVADGNPIYLSLSFEDTIKYFMEVNMGSDPALVDSLLEELHKIQISEGEFLKDVRLNENIGNFYGV